MLRSHRFLNNQDPQVFQEVGSESQFYRKCRLKKRAHYKNKIPVSTSSIEAHKRGQSIKRAAHRHRSLPKIFADEYPEVRG